MRKLFVAWAMALLLVGALAMGAMAEQAAVGMNYWRATNEVKVGSSSGDSSFAMFSFGGEMALADQWSVSFMFESGDGDDYDQVVKSVDYSSMQLGVKYAIQPGITINGGYLSADVDLDKTGYTMNGLLAGLSFSLMVSDQIDFYGDIAFVPWLHVDGPGDDDGTATYVNLCATYELSSFDIEAGYRMRNYSTDDLKVRFYGPYIGISTRF